MHMADALLSPTVGGAAWVASAGLIAWSSRRVQAALPDDHVPLMGVVGAFVFAAQMINFTIPGTGSSGHIGGGLLLAILLGPHAAFLSLASVLFVQALFFADGGLLALGCNILNLGLLPCFVAYPLVYRGLTRGGVTTGRVTLGAVAAAIVGLQLGALGVVVQTTASGVTELGFGTFALLMLPIHLAIGLIEGLATAAVALFVWRARPELVEGPRASSPGAPGSLRAVVVGLLAVTALCAGVGAWFASTKPDGLEWAIARVTGEDELVSPDGGVHEALEGLQAGTAILPDYGFAEGAPAVAEAGEGGPAVDAGTTTAGLVGSGATLLLMAAAGVALRRRAHVTGGAPGASTGAP